MLGTLEGHGILDPARAKREDSVRDMRGTPTGPPGPPASDPQPEIAAPLAELRPLRARGRLRTRRDGSCGTRFVDRHHYLGYRRPFGAHVRYFVTDRQGRRLGCLLVRGGEEGAALPRPLDRLERTATRDRRRHLMVVNSRFLVFPWVRSKNLASPVLAMAARRLADDWERIHGWRPVLRGTFVDETRFRATRYRAANRERIGETAAGRGKSVKGACVMPLRVGERA